MDLKEIKEKIAAAGVVGAGGAGFPAAVKLAPGADTLLINASECEPLLHTDFYLLKYHLKTILQGAELILAAAEIPRAIIGVKAHNAKRLQWEQGQKLSEHVSVHILPDAYPIGDEIILTYQILHRIIRPGKLPISEGVIVMNAESLYNACHAVRDGTPVTEKWLTVAGKVKHPVVLKVPVGTPVRELLAQLGETVPEDCVVVDGGPAMGAIIDPATAVVKKTTKGITIFPDSIPAIANKLAQNRVINIHATSNCCQCTICTDMCPRALIGYPLAPHKIVRVSMQEVEQMPELFAEAQLCSNCGVCELVSCCQGISPRRVYAQVKGILAKNKIKYTKDIAPEANPERDYRIVPASRFKRLSGVTPLDAMPEFLDKEIHPQSVKLLTRMHVGAPAVPAVQVGDAVKVGQLVAEANGMISARIHSSVNGKVTAVSASEITIVPDGE